MQVYKVQRVSVTIPGGSASANGSLSNFTNAAKMVVFQSWTLPAASNLFGAKAFVKLTITDANTLTASRIDSTTGEAIDVEAYVIQFGDDTNIYKGTFTIASGANTTNVNVNGGSPMALNDLTKAFVWAYWTHTDTTGTTDWNQGAGMVSVHFTSTSAIDCKRYTSTPGDISGNFFVVESSTLSVQHEEFTTATTSLTTLTDDYTNDVGTLDHTFVQCSYRWSGTTWLSDACWVTDLPAGDFNTVRFRRHDTDNMEGNFRYQIITDSSINVQRGEFTHNATSNTATLPTAVDLARAVPICNGSGHPLHTKNDDFTAGHQDEYVNKMWLSGPTTLNVASTNAGGNMLMTWQVVEFTAESTASPARIMVIT
jgi:hypothetical protein